jgi:hypothetical protein
VKRPASGDGTNHPDWTVAGVLDPARTGDDLRLPAPPVGD